MSCRCVGMQMCGLCASINPESPGAAKAIAHQRAVRKVALNGDDWSTAELRLEVKRLRGELRWHADEIDRACAQVRGECVCGRAADALDEMAKRLSKALAEGKVKP